MRRIRQVAAAAVLLALLIGVPWAMAATIGNPLHGWGALKAGDLSNSVVIDVLAAVVWVAIAVAWLQFVVSVGYAVRDVLHVQRRTASVPGWPAPAASAALASKVPGEFTGIPHLARWLVATALLVGTAATVASPTARAAAQIPAAAPAAALAPATPHHSTGTSTSSTAGSTTASTARSSPEPRVYVVPADGSGPDTYWDIARTMLGSGERWHEVWDLNQGRTQDDGSVMTQAGLLMPGWTVLVPAASPSPQIVRVAPEDTLTQIAVDHGSTEPAVWDANKGRVMPDGRTFTDPNLILPGETIIIPGPATTTPPHTGRPVTPTVPTPPTRPLPPVATPTTPSAPSAPSAPSTPATPAPAPATPTPTSPGPVVATPATADDHTAAPAASEAPVLAFAAGGGLLLAGVSLTALVAYRRRQFRHRHPGRTIANTEPDLVRMERAVLSAGRPAQADVAWLDQALRGLVHGVAESADGRLPDVIAVRVSADELELVLTGPSGPAPAPWRVSEDSTRWSIARGDELPYDAERRGHYFAPFPTLASVGYNAAGEHWLLDLERIAALSLTGDAERCLNLARFLAAELAHNTWSEMLQVTLVGFGGELVAANPDRLSYTEDLAGAIDNVTRRYSAAVEGMADLDTTVLDGRLHDLVGDLWAPNVLLIAPHLAGDRQGLDELLAAMKAQPARTTVALVLADDPDRVDAARWQMNVDEFGRLTVPALGLELVAEQIPAEEAAQLAQMLALAAVPTDEPIPAGQGEEPWDEYSDACGGLTIAAPDVEVAAASPRFTPGAVPVLHPAGAAPWRDSVLPLSPQTYLDKAATTEQDLRALAPVVDDEIRTKVEQADPNLDVDLAAWRAEQCPRPRITVLGNVKVRAQGGLPERSPQERLNTEAAVYLATRPKSGVLSSVFAQAMWPNDPDIVGKPVVRTTAAMLRKWLGIDPDTGRHYLPADLREGRTARYCIEEALVDAELFRRLRIRGLARGAAGIEDLWAALDLVQGPPFHELPMPDKNLAGEPLGPGGWLWLTDANVNLESVYAAMVVDTAHTVADYHLGAGEPERAAKAAQVSLRIGSYGDVPLLDLVCACMAMDKKAEAEAYVQQLMHNHSAEVEEDLPPRTAEVLFRLRRQWSERAS